MSDDKKHDASKDEAQKDEPTLAEKLLRLAKATIGQLTTR